MPRGKAWEYVLGDGLAVDGPCTVYGFYFAPTGTGNYMKVYDGVNVAQGKFFGFVRSAGVDSVSVVFPLGVSFASGVYLDSSFAGSHTTIVFELDE